MSAVEDIFDNLGEDPSYYDGEHDPSFDGEGDDYYEPPQPVDWTKAPTASQLVEFTKFPVTNSHKYRSYGISDEYDQWSPITLPDGYVELPNQSIPIGMSWDELSANFRAGWLPGIANEAIAESWSKKLGVGSSDSVKRFMNLRRGSARDPSVPVTGSAATAIGEAYAEAAADYELKDYWLDMPLFRTTAEYDAYGWCYSLDTLDWSAFVDDETQRFGFVKFLNGSDHAESKDDYVMFWFKLDGANLSLHIPVMP
jgi:hypothetical protein